MVDNRQVTALSLCQGSHGDLRLRLDGGLSVGTAAGPSKDAQIGWVPILVCEEQYGNLGFTSLLRSGLY